MGNYKLLADSFGRVTLEVSGIPTEAEKKDIDSLIAPDGFVAVQVFKKLKTLGLYIGELTGGLGQVSGSGTPPPLSTPVQAERPKFEFEVCPTCGNKTLATYTVKKEGKNKGKKFKTCKTEGCTYSWDWKKSFEGNVGG